MISARWENKTSTMGRVFFFLVGVIHVSVTLFSPFVAHYMTLKLQFKAMLIRTTRNANRAIMPFEKFHKFKGIFK